MKHGTKKKLSTIHVEEDVHELLLREKERADGRSIPSIASELIRTEARRRGLMPKEEPKESA